MSDEKIEAIIAQESVQRLIREWKAAYGCTMEEAIARLRGEKK